MNRNRAIFTSFKNPCFTPLLSTQLHHHQRPNSPIFPTFSSSLSCGLWLYSCAYTLFLNLFNNRVRHLLLPASSLNKSIVCQSRSGVLFATKATIASHVTCITSHPACLHLLRPPSPQKSSRIFMPHAFCSHPLPLVRRASSSGAQSHAARSRMLCKCC